MSTTAGAGHFTILDPAIVKDEDLGVNFFLVDEDIGRSRAEACTQWLQELNPDVQGYADSTVRTTIISAKTNTESYSQ